MRSAFYARVVPPRVDENVWRCVDVGRMSLCFSAASIDLVFLLGIVGRMGIFGLGLPMPASRGSCVNGCGNSRKKMLRNERDYKKIFISLHAHKFMLY